MVTYAVMGDIVLEVLEQPTVPVRPTNAVNAKRAMFSVTLMVAAGMFVLMVVLSYLKDVVRSKEEAEQKLDCWCLSEILHERKHYRLKDLLKRKKHGILITNPETGFRYVTTMNKLRRRVEQHMQKGKVLMVTSVMENEGKSTVSANLALAMARKYQKVLLVDLDLHKPACRKILDHEIPAHFTHQVIRGEVELADAVCKDKRSRLHMLFAKRCAPQDVNELLGSPEMGRMLEQARKEFDYVIIDMAPMSVVSDTEAVMELTDASLLVVRQNVVRSMDLNRAIGDLQRGRAKLLGCVLNNVYSTFLSTGQGYQYGGYGNYHYYGSYAEKSSRK
jgi:capsular exopolysaccharide synthesis family protein